MHRLISFCSIVVTIGFFFVACTPPAASPTAAIPTQSADPADTAQPKRTPSAVSIPPGAIRVPEDWPTIQAAIDAALDGGLVLIAPGTYTENLTITEKSVSLASYYHMTGDPRFIRHTIIDGNGQTVITVADTAANGTEIIGLTIRNGDDGIEARADLRVLHNHIRNNDDGIDYTDCGGLNQGNIYEENRDDGIDLDGASHAIIENNVIRNNENDGIEIRLHEYRGPVLSIIIRNNTISGNVEDGIQLIDYPDLSSRSFWIERNIIHGNLMAGLGLMDNGETREDFRAASIPEPIYLINNTFLDNPYSVAGGNNLIALNNLFIKSSVLALKNVGGQSIAAYNLFWNNASDSQGSNIDAGTTLFSNPMLDAAYQPRPGSPAIDGGTAHFEWNNLTILGVPPEAYSGSTLDLGAYETDF